MSFNYNPLRNTMPPMHMMTPTAGNFMSKLPNNLLGQQSQLSNGNEAITFDFSITSTTSGPMDLETNIEPECINGDMDSCDNVSNPNVTNNDGLVFNNMMGIQPQSFMLMPGVMMDPSMLGIQQFPILNQLTNHSSTPAPSTSANAKSHDQSSVTNGTMLPKPDQAIKEIIHCQNCTLIPPNPNAPPPTTRERPAGCRTVFVGGLPENITEAIIHEIFERCGEITTLRLSKKNFCHIRFIFEASVDSAIYLSGYRIRIGNNQDATNTGRLHVDYAQARDDQYEYECRQRQLQREQRHRERIEKDRLRPSSPPPIIHYTDHEATSVAEKIKADESFLKAVQILITWLERGDCIKKNSNIFYSMIQSTNSHVRRILNEKCQHEDELIDAKANYKKSVQTVVDQFNQIEKVFNAASHKKVWDHFTKAQRKNIDQWCKQALDIRMCQLDRVGSDTDEMEISDDENYGPCKNKRTKYDNEKLKDENDSLRCQLQGYKNEMDLTKSDGRCDTDLKNKQIKMLQDTIKNLQRSLIESNIKEKSMELRITELEQCLKDANIKELLLRTKVVNTKNNSQLIQDQCINMESLNDGGSCETPLQEINDENLILSLITTFLVIHPNGAKLDTIHAYVMQFTPKTTPVLIHKILEHQHLFLKDEATTKWNYIGFKIPN